MSMLTASEIINQLNQARELAWSSRETFPQVLRQILSFTANPDPHIKLWCSTFLRDAFMADDSVLSKADKMDLAIDSLDSVVSLSQVEDAAVFKNCIDTSVVLYKLVFRYVSDNDGCDPIWNKLNELRTSLVARFTTPFPLPPALTEEQDLLRSLDVKIFLMKFMSVVIDYTTKSNSGVKNFNLNFVNPNHTLVKKQQVQAEAAAMLDMMLEILNFDVLVPQLITPLMAELSVLVRRKSQFVPRILNAVESYDTLNKLQSNYQTIDQFKLARKYVDRIMKIFINHLLKYQLLPPNYEQSLTRKMNTLIQRGDDIRRKNILLPTNEDNNIKKRKFEGFENSSKRIKALDYKSLYCLTDLNNDLNNFDLATLPQNILISMTLAALNRATPARLTKALDIIADRYKNAISGSVQDSSSGTNGVKGDDEDDEDDENVEFSSSSVYTLPPPKELSFYEKKEQINLIIKNFFKLCEKNIESIEEIHETESDGVNKELTKIAISSWKKDSWLVILTRLATRGMRTIDSTNDSIDKEKSNEMSDMIRLAIFDYFLENIHGRIDLIIEWLNEEWYSEKVFNELQKKNQIKKGLMAEYEKHPEKVSGITEKINQTMEETTIETPIYNRWAGKLLDSIIPFLESNDRKIFIRLLSDLPYLNEELVMRIKSLCFDPVRSKLGFLSLQFLIMYRPPVKEICIKILKELADGDQQDLKDEANKLLAKYT